MFQLPSFDFNFFNIFEEKKPEHAKPAPAPVKPKPKKEEALSPLGFWVGNVIGDQNKELQDFIMVNAVEGKEKEAEQEFLDFCFLETCKKLNRRP